VQHFHAVYCSTTTDLTLAVVHAEVLESREIISICKGE